MSFLDSLTFIIGLYCAMKSLQRIFKSQYSMLHVCVIFFFAIQVLPLLVDSFNDISLLQSRAKYEYYAMIDGTTCWIYDVFCCITSTILLNLANKYSKYTMRITLGDIMSKNSTLSVFFFILMFSPLVGVIIAPDPSVYTYFSYFYTQSYNPMGVEYLYHGHVMLYFNYLAFFAIICYYFQKSDTKFGSYASFVASCLLVWVDGKRGFLAFLIVGVLFIDFIRQKKTNTRLIRKSIVLIGVFLAYFVVYSNLTEKHSDDSFYPMYNAYFSREAEVKLAIYSRLPWNTKMLPYDGASLLYNMIAFVPRSFWSAKPYGFFNYLTAYAYYGSGETFLTYSNYQVNIWSEFIANMGIIGYFCSLLFLGWIIKKSERTTNKLLNIIGGLFCLMYLFLGFEMLVMLSFYLWIYLLIRHRNYKV